MHADGPLQKHFSSGYQINREIRQSNNQPSVPTISLGHGGQPGGASATIRMYNSKSTQTTPSFTKVPKSDSEDAHDTSEDYSHFMPGAYTEGPAQHPTTLVHAPIVHEAQFSDPHTPTPAQRPRWLPSLTPCPPGRYPSSSPVPKPVEFDPSPYWGSSDSDSDPELPGQDFKIEKEDDPFN